MPVITRRPATRKDTMYARELHRDGYYDVVKRQFGLWDPETQEGFFRQKWKPKNFEIILADGVPCGYILVERKKDCLIVSELVIHSTYRSMGIGTKLLNEVIDQAAREGLAVRLQVLKKNTAVKLYKRLGFVQTRETATHFLMKRDLTP